MNKLFVLFFFWAIFAGSAFAQQMTMTTPKHHVGDGFTESIGTSWGLSGRNWNFNYGGGGATTRPMFGNYDPGSGLQTGFQFQRGGVQGYFNGWAGQGTERFYGGESPSVTLLNGQQGYFGDVSSTPFVVGLTPVVGGWHGGPGDAGYPDGNYMSVPQGNQTVREALARAKAAQEAGVTSSSELYRAAVGSAPAGGSGRNTSSGGSVSDRVSENMSAKSAERPRIASTNPGTAEAPVLSVAAMRKMREMEKQQGNEAAMELVEKGKNAEAAGNLRNARSYYKEAISLADEELAAEIRERLRKSGE